MIGCKKKIRTEEILLVLIFTVISIAAVFLGDYFVTETEYHNAQKGFYSSRSKIFYLKATGSGDFAYDLNERMEDIYSIINECKGVYLLHALFGMGYDTFYGIYVGESAPAVYAVEGRYFTAGDMRRKEKVCVVGINAGTYAQIDEQNGERTVTMPHITGKGTFQVIGTVGSYNSATNINFAVVINMNGEWDMNPADLSLPMIIDGSRKGEVERCYMLLSSYFEKVGIRMVDTELPLHTYDVTDFFGMELLNILIYLFSGFTVILSTVPLTLLWSEKRRKSVAVRRMMGETASAAALRMYGRLFLLFNMGFSFGLFLMASMWILGLYDPNKTIIATVCAAYGIALFSNLLIALVPLVKTMRVEPGDALRGE